MSHASRIVIAVVMLVSVSFVSLLALLFPVWVTAVSILILRRWQGSAPELAGIGASPS